MSDFGTGSFMDAAAGPAFAFDFDFDFDSAFGRKSSVEKRGGGGGGNQPARALTTTPPAASKTKKVVEFVGSGAVTEDNEEAGLIDGKVESFAVRTSKQLKTFFLTSIGVVGGI